MPNLTWNNRGQILIGGVPRLLRAIYDSDLSFGNNGWDNFVAARNYARFRFNVTLHVQSGTLGNSIKLGHAIAGINAGMYCLTVGNFFGNFTFDPAFFTSGNPAQRPQDSSFDILNNTSYTFTPEGTGGFQTLWPACAQSFAIYSADEPQTAPSGWVDNAVPPSVPVQHNNMTNVSFATDLTGWTTTVNGGGTGTVTITASGGGAGAGNRAQLAGGTSTSIDLSQAGPATAGTLALTTGSNYKFYWRIVLANVRVRLIVGATTVIDASFAPGTYAQTFVPASTSFQVIFSVNGGVTAQVDEVGISLYGDPPPVPSTRGRDDCVTLYNYYKGIPSLASHPVWVTFLNDNVYQWQDWSTFPIGDLVGCDIYVIGQGPESDPASGGTLGVNSYGYMNFEVAEACALARYYCSQYSGAGVQGAGVRVPNVVLQANKFGTPSRFITQAELISHGTIALAELRGGIFTWWAMGTQNGALDEANVASVNATAGQTVFTTSFYAEEAVDVAVVVGGVLQPAANYTIQNLGNATLIRSGNFWVYQFPVQVTLATAPGVGVNVAITVKRWPATRKAMVLQFLEDFTKFIDANESGLTQQPSTTLVSANSTQAATFLAWRTAYTDVLRQNPGNDRVCWLFGTVQRYQDEWTRLTAATPDLSLSVHMQDQRGNVRWCAWDLGGQAIVAAYNLLPDPQTNVTHTLTRAATRAQVMFENRDATLSGGGLILTDTFGGASSLRQGPFGQGHIYLLTFTGSAAIFAAITAPVASTTPLQVPLPAGAQLNDCLLWATRVTTAANPTITDAAGGVWTQVGVPAAGTGVRLVIYVSIYNGTQTAPTITDTGDHRQSTIVAYRGVDTANPINQTVGGASNFAVQLADIDAVTTTADNCLIVDVIALAGPLSISNTIFSGWANANLTNETERADQATNLGAAGGSLGLADGSQATAGATGTTHVDFTGNSFRAVWKKIALKPTTSVNTNVSGQPASGPVAIAGGAANPVQGRVLQPQTSVRGG